MHVLNLGKTVDHHFLYLNDRMIMYPSGLPLGKDDWLVSNIQHLVVKDRCVVMPVYLPFTQILDMLPHPSFLVQIY